MGCWNMMRWVGRVVVSNLASYAGGQGFDLQPTSVDSAECRSYTLKDYSFYLLYAALPRPVINREFSIEERTVLATATFNYLILHY